VIWIIGTVIAACACVRSVGQGIIFQHLGATDPVSEGFSAYGRPGVPVNNDLGLATWSIDSRGGGLQYFGRLSESERGLLATGDWILSARVRVIEGSTSYVGFFTLSESFGLVLGVQGNGDPVVYVSSLSPSGALFLNGAGAGYHEYELEYHAASGLADLWVDGSERLRDIRGKSGNLYATGAVLWGGGIDGSGSVANWNSVSLSIVPEPCTRDLFCLGGLLMGAGAWATGGIGWRRRFLREIRYR